MYLHKKKKRFFLFLIIILVFHTSCLFAQKENPKITFTQKLRYDIREKKDHLFIERINLNFEKKLNKYSILISPFTQLYRSLDKPYWDRKELGFQVGLNPWKWIYIGENFLYTWTYNEGDSFQTEPIVIFSHYPFKSKPNLKGYLLNKYTYDFSSGEGTRNEVSAGLNLILRRNLELDLGWRHIDRIHDYDSDTIELSFSLSF